MFGDNDNEDGYVPLSAGAAATWHLHRITRSQLNLCGLSLSSPPFLLRYKPVLSVSLTSSWQNCSLTKDYNLCFDNLCPVHVVVFKDLIGSVETVILIGSFFQKGQWQFRGARANSICAALSLLRLFSL